VELLNKQFEKCASIITPLNCSTSLTVVQVYNGNVTVGDVTIDYTTHNA